MSNREQDSAAFNAAHLAAKQVHFCGHKADLVVAQIRNELQTIAACSLTLGDVPDAPRPGDAATYLRAMVTRDEARADLAASVSSIARLADALESK